MDKDYCPNTPNSKHLFAGNYATVSTKADFEPTTIGDTAENTLYRRQEYTIVTCQCGYSKKRKVVYETDG